MERSHKFGIIAAFFLIAFCAVRLDAAEFRLDNEIRPGNVKSTTYLLDGDFFSMIGQNGEITYYDSKAKTFSILDPALRLQTRLDLGETKDKIELLRQEILNSPKLEAGSFNAFVVKPIFQSEFDENSGDWALWSPWFDYVMETAVFPNADAARQYNDFCDLSCHLNYRIAYSKSMLVRLEVNKLLAARSRFPKKISVTIYPNGKSPLTKSEKMESAHVLVVRLTEEDRQRITQAREALRTFPAVTFSEYERKVAEKIKPGK